MVRSLELSLCEAGSNNEQSVIEGRLRRARADVNRLQYQFGLSTPRVVVTPLSRPGIKFCSNNFLCDD